MTILVFMSLAGACVLIAYVTDFVKQRRMVSIGTERNRALGRRDRSFNAGFVSR